MSSDHALHNEELASELLLGKKYYDWVITTAFYSALHYSEFQLFPFQFGPSEYSCFDDWYPAFKSNQDNKHDARKRLVYSNISATAGAAYNWLKDECWTARYYDYTANEEYAKTAILKLKIVKAELSKLVQSQDNT